MSWAYTETDTLFGGGAGGKESCSDPELFWIKNILFDQLMKQKISSALVLVLASDYNIDWTLRK